MLSEEEMKAIEDLKDMIGKSKDLMEEEFYKLATIHNIQAVATILNLIEKQSKEIEELKETLKCTQNSWFEDTQKIEEMKKQLDLDNECEIALNSKVMDLEKEIEELKNADLTTVYLNGVYDGEKKVEDKIKAMLENEIINISGFECVAKEDVQSLLEKE